MKKLSYRQKLFVYNYIGNGFKKATQAAIDAGYSPKSADSRASQLLADPVVSEFLKFETDKLTEDIMSELKSKFAIYSSETVNVLYNIMQSPGAKDRDRIAAAREILDRAGFKVAEKVEIAGIDGGVNMLGEILEQLQK